AQGLGTKRAEDMAHLPVGGDGGSLAALRGLHASRRIYIHVNNTNPLLREDSAERRQVEAAGWQVAWDGMEGSLGACRRRARRWRATTSWRGCAGRARRATTTITAITPSCTRES